MARRPLVGALLAVGLGLGVAIGAVVSGLQAAKALQARVVGEHHLRPDDPRARPIDIVEPNVRGNRTRIMWA